MIRVPINGPPFGGRGRACSWEVTSWPERQELLKRE